MKDEILQCGDMTYSQSTNHLSVDNVTALLSRGESIILQTFMSSPDRIVTKSQIGDKLHSFDGDYTENSIHLHIHRIRSKMSDLGSENTIKTIRGIGYLMSKK